jgi:hypothetical protein
MKSHRKELWFEVPRRRQLINITPQVEAALAESGIREGLCLVNAMHISECGLTSPPIEIATFGLPTAPIELRAAYHRAEIQLFKHSIGQSETL